MTELRRRMIEDMQLHGFAPKTQKCYVDAVKGLAKHYGRSPDLLGDDDIRNFFLFLINEKGAARGRPEHLPLRYQVFLRENITAPMACFQDTQAS